MAALIVVSMFSVFLLSSAFAGGLRFGERVLFVFLAAVVAFSGLMILVL